MSKKQNEQAPSEPLLSDADTAVLDAPAEVPSVTLEVAEESQPESVSTVVADDQQWVASDKIPTPFRPSHLSAMMDDYAKANGVERSHMKGGRFIDEQGLPNPTILYRVSAFKGGTKEPVATPASVEAVDPSEAVRKYKEDIAANRNNADLLKPSTKFEVAILEK